jgi:hypothetical protein
MEGGPSKPELVTHTSSLPLEGLAELPTSLIWDVLPSPCVQHIVNQPQCLFLARVFVWIPYNLCIGKLFIDGFDELCKVILEIVCAGCRRVIRLESRR